MSLLLLSKETNAFLPVLLALLNLRYPILIPISPSPQWTLLPPHCKLTHFFLQSRYALGSAVSTPLAKAIDCIGPGGGNSLKVIAAHLPVPVVSVQTLDALACGVLARVKELAGALAAEDLLDLWLHGVLDVRRGRVGDARRGRGGGRLGRSGHWLLQFGRVAVQAGWGAWDGRGGTEGQEALGGAACVAFAVHSRCRLSLPAAIK